MTKPTKKLTTYQRGVIALRQEREWKARETVRAEALRRERYRDAANDAAVREARHNAAMITVHQAREQASQDSASLAAFLSWKIAFWAIILALFFAHRL
jgi:hypothetical protein